MLGGVQLVYAGHLMLAWRFILHRRIDKGVICIFSIFDGGWSVCVCVCFTYTHTHTLHVGYSDVSHLESPNNPDGLNLRNQVFCAGHAGWRGHYRRV